MPEHGDLSVAKRALLERWLAGRWSAAPARFTAPASGPHYAHASVQQLELWNLHQRSPGTSSPNISFAATLAAEVDAGALAAAVQQLALRHESLRTTLWAEDGVVWQQIHDEPLATLETTDLSALPPGLALDRGRQLANEAVSRPFDLVSGPLARVLLYRLERGRHMLAVIVHHAIADGWSLAIAMKETARLYDASVQGRPAGLAPMSFQYRDFAEWQWRWMDGAEAREHARYWEQRAVPHCATQLPSDFAPESKPGLRGGLMDLTLSLELSAAVRRVAAAEHASAFVVLIAAFAVLLHERTDDELICIGTPVACRDRPEFRPLIGCFASMVPTFVTVPDGVSFRKLLVSVRAESALAVTHESYPLDIYLNRVEPERDFAQRPLFAAQFGMQPPMQPFQLAGASLQPLALDRGQTRTPFAVHLWNDQPSIHGTVGYSTALFCESTAEEMTSRYVEILDRATSDPSRPVRDL